MGGVVKLEELQAEDRAALRALHMFIVKALRQESVQRLRDALSTPEVIALGVGLAILDRLTDSDEEETS